MSKNKSKEFAELPTEKLEVDKKEVGNRKNKLIKALEFLKKEYDFRYNLITKSLEFKDKKSQYYKYWEDRDHRTIKIELDINGKVDLADDTFRNLIFSPRVSNDYHPFREYFNNLTPWDQKTDHIQNYLNQVQLEDEHMRTYFIVGFKKWLVGMVKGLYVDDPHMYNQNNICLVFYGGQNIHKTTFLNDLIPNVFRMDYLYTGNYIISGSKDHEEMIGTKWIINLEELSSFNRTEIENVKGRITQEQVTITRRYGKAETRLKRRASFCGTTNNKEFITDMTGSRRFLVYSIKRIDYKPNDAALNDIFSQAFYLMKNGFVYWITEEDTNLVDVYNEQYRLKSMEEDLVLKHFAKPSEDDIINNQYTPMSATDITTWLTDKYNKININNTVVKNIGKVLSRYKFEKVSKRMNGESIKLWMVKPLGAIEMSFQHDNMDNLI